MRRVDVVLHPVVRRPLAVAFEGVLGRGVAIVLGPPEEDLAQAVDLRAVRIAVSSAAVWCLRCMAVHSFVIIPVVSHSQNRKKCCSTGCNSRALCAENRCRYTVTPMIVTCVITST